MKLSNRIAGAECSAINPERLFESASNCAAGQLNGGINVRCGGEFNARTAPKCCAASCLNPVIVSPASPSTRIAIK